MKKAFSWKTRWLAGLLSLMMVFACSFSALAEEQEGEAPPELPEGDEFPGSSGEPGDDGFLESSGDSSGDAAGMGNLTDENFNSEDIPDDYLEPIKSQGRVEKQRYFTTNGNREGKSITKSFMVYLPVGYDESDEPYNVMYILHAASGSVKNYLDPDKATSFQNLLDHMIENGELEPLIVVAATYYSSDGFEQFMPLAMQVEVTASFPSELVNDIIPVVSENYRTYAASGSIEDIVASRDHRAIVGFSLGGVTAWYVFLQEMRCFKWFLPISEASWDDGEGGTSGIWDSDVSAQVLYDAVIEQGYGKDDFRLFVATGTEDTAFDISTSQMVSLLEYSDMFMPGDNTSCSMMMGGTHTLKALYTYLYHIMPDLFQGQ